MKNETVITKDPSGKQLHVTRNFNAPVEKVWRAWTEKEILEQWWAPKPFKAETKILDFVSGGLWLYCMVGPAGERHWCRVDIESVETNKSFASTATFCDEEGNINPDFPPMHWKAKFKSNGENSTVEVSINFDSEADLEKIVSLGFKEGFTMALGNLDEVLEA
ncbi:SRPBCC domain-containing protein [Mucilaginibacter limnophilus]|uniref:SRPBCC domain-containing protein n=1 Tax=Mucilaginibacter limnophilus TaxID=1932778 RepID=A0A3S2Y5H4_9SPHI|nr:SRPBCC domain-containing protein [Mucilaginibacter limnophilus]RVU02498.1 SRPBCC domain-containing protein [Mucilaginibacter limnophilus]